MTRAAALALFSALLGGAIALVARRRPAVLERTRTFAFAAAAGVVAFHLLPEALPAQGLIALLWMGLGFALPWVLEAGTRAFGVGLLQRHGVSSARVSAEVGFAALVFHSVAEGLALVAALASGGNADLEIALVAHHAPLTAAVVLPFLELRGPRAVALRASLIGAAGVAGVLASGAVPGFGEGSFLETATALTAGALLHVVSDEIRAQRFGSPWERAADLAACLAGLLVAGLSAVLNLRHSESAAGPLLDFLRALSGVALVSAPALLCGAVAAALLAVRTRFFRWDAFLLALVLLGPLPAMALATLQVVLALPIARFVARPPIAAPVAAELVALVRQRAPPLLALLAMAAGLYVSTAMLPRTPLIFVALGLVLLVAARLDEAGAVVVAAVLVHKGFGAPFALALVALGPQTRAMAAHRLSAAARPLVVAALAAFLVVVGALALSGALSRAMIASDAALSMLREPFAAQVGSAPVGAASAVVLVAIALATLWSAGVRGWFSPLRHRTA